MSNSSALNFIPTICYFDGELVIDDEMCGKYVGGFTNRLKFALAVT